MGGLLQERNIMFSPCLWWQQDSDGDKVTYPISSRIPICSAKTETPLLFPPLFSVLYAGSSIPSQPFRLYLQKHRHKNIFIVHSICPAMTLHKTSMLKIWGVNTLDASLQMLREVVLSMCLIKSFYAYLFRAIFRSPTSGIAPCVISDCSSSCVSQAAWISILFPLYDEQKQAEISGCLETWELLLGSQKYWGTSAYVGSSQKQPCKKYYEILSSWYWTFQWTPLSASVMRRQHLQILQGLNSRKVSCCMRYFSPVGS